MNREEAINVLQKYTDTDSGISKVVAKAHKMAIMALEQEKEYVARAEESWDRANELIEKLIEQEPSEEYKRGWHDAIATALKETHNYYTEDGVFRAIQEESLIGVGMIQEPRERHWILDETDNSITCDGCGCLMWANDIHNGDAYYCPNCGAKMEG